MDTCVVFGNGLHYYSGKLCLLVSAVLLSWPCPTKLAERNVLALAHSEHLWIASLVYVVGEESVSRVYKGSPVLGCLRSHVL